MAKKTYKIRWWSKKQTEVIPKVPLRERIGKVTLRTALWAFRWASFIKCIPYELVSKERVRVRVFKATWRRCLFYAVNFIIFTYNLFQIIGFILNILMNGLTADSAMHIIYFSYAILSVVFFSTLLTKPEEGAMLINQIDFLMQISKERKLWCKRYWYCTGFAIMSVNYYMLLLQFIAAPTLVAFFLLNPQGSMYVYSLIPSKLQAEIGVKLACFLLETAIVYWNFTILNAIYCVWASYVFQNILWLNELNRRKASQTYRAWAFQVMNYRYIKVLNVLHNDFNLHFSTGFVGIISVFATLFIYCSLSTVDLVSIFVYVLFPTIGAFCILMIVGFYPYISSWHFKSMDFFQKIRTEVYLNGEQLDRDMILREVKALTTVKNKQSYFGYTSIAVSQASLMEIFSDVFLLKSF